MDSDHFSKHNSKKHQGRTKYEEIVEATQTRLTFAANPKVKLFDYFTFAFILNGYINSQP